jgi:hypothetical protein
MANDHLAAVGFCYVLWQRNSSGEEKGYHILYGSWRLNEDWKPVIDLCFAALNGQQLLTTSSYP